MGLEPSSIRVLITGAGRGLGLEFTRQYLAQGARVFAAARRPDAGELAELLGRYPAQLTPLRLDVNRDEDLQGAAAVVQEREGALDLLINNAGVNPRSVGLGQYESGVMLQALRTNAVAPILLSQALLPLLRAGERPRVVNISSQVGSFAWNQRGMAPLYAASKAALNMYTRAFAHEATGVITVAVHPGWVQTDMGGHGAPLTPAQSVEQLRALIDRLSPADSGRFFNFNGQPHPY